MIRSVTLPLGVSSIRLVGCVPEGVAGALAPFDGLPERPGLTLHARWGTPQPITGAQPIDMRGLKISADRRAFVVVVRNGAAEVPILRADLGDDGCGVLTLDSAHPKHDLAEVVVSILFQVLALRELSMRDAVLLHASGVADRRAVLFLGESGAGKTTAARNCAGRARQFCDDRCVVYVDELGNVQCLATPFRQRAKTVPGRFRLGGAFLVEQGIEPALHDLRGLARVKALASCAFLPFWDRIRLEASMGTVETIVGAAPVQRLVVPDSPGFVSIIERSLQAE